MRDAGLQGPASRRALRAVPRALAHARARLGLRGRAHRRPRSTRWTFFRARGIAADKVPAERPAHPRAEPLLVHGPLLPRRLDPPQGAVHGQVAALQAADAVDLHARRRVPGAARLRRRGGVHHRARDPRRAAARSRCTARAGARAPASCPSGAARHRPARARVRRDDRPGRDPRLVEGAQLEAAPVPEGDGPLRRPDPLRAVDEPTRDQQQAVADAIFAEIRALYDQLDAVGRRGVVEQRRELRRA